MAQETRVARRYAAALFGVAVRDETIDAIEQDLLVVETSFREIEYLRQAIRAPVIDGDRKHELLSEAFGEKITATTLNFLYLLVRKRRENVLEECIAEFRRLADERANRVFASVHSAVALSASQMTALSAALAKRTGKNVTVENRIDASILGGVRVLIGDEIIDGCLLDLPGAAEGRHDGRALEFRP